MGRGFVSQLCLPLEYELESTCEASRLGILVPLGDHAFCGGPHAAACGQIVHNSLERPGQRGRVRFRHDDTVDSVLDQSSRNCSHRPTAVANRRSSR